MDTLNISPPNIRCQLPFEALEILSNSPKNLGVTIQHKDKGYIYMNPFILKQYKITKLNDVLYKKDDYLTQNQNLIKKYHNYYDYVFCEEKTLEVTEAIEPKNLKGFIKVFKGKIFPLYLNSDIPNAMLSIGHPENIIGSLAITDVLEFSLTEIREHLTQKRYAVVMNNINIYLSRQEILCLIGLLQSRNACQISIMLGITQNTVESYIKNLKNKCGMSGKTELIDCFIKHKILEQIIV